MTKHTPAVSVIITTFNRAGCLSNAIQSVLDQTMQDFEIIVADDSSTDDTVDIINDFIKKDKRFACVQTDVNSGGPAVPKNLALRIASGKYIATLDSDDVWCKDKLEKQIACFNKGGDSLGLVACDYTRKTKKGELYVRLEDFERPELKILEHDYLGSGSGMLYKRCVFDIIGLFDENLNSCQDWEMRIRLLRRYDLDIVHESLFMYVIHDSNISVHVDISKREKDVEYVVNKHIELYQKYRKLHAGRKRYAGTWYMMGGEWIKGVNNLFKSLVLNPFGFKVYILFIVSLFGPSVYRFVNRISS